MAETFPLKPIIRKSVDPKGRSSRSQQSSSKSSSSTKSVHFAPGTEFVERNQDSPFWKDIHERRRMRVLAQNKQQASRAAFSSERSSLFKFKNIRKNPLGAIWGSKPKHPLLPFLKLGWTLQDDDFYLPKYEQRLRKRNLGQPTGIQGALRYFCCSSKFGHDAYSMFPPVDLDDFETVY